MVQAYHNMSGVLNVLASYYSASGTPTYPSGATWATSFREIPGLGYTGAVCRFYRDSDGAEVDMYYYAGGDNLNTARDGSGSSKETWGGSASVYAVKMYDQSGNSNHSYNGTISRTVRLSNAGTWYTANGKLAGYIDGTRYHTLVSTITGAESCTFLVVGKRAATAKAMYPITGYTSGVGVYGFTWYSDDNIYARSNSGYIVSNSTDSGSSQFIGYDIMAGSTRKIYKNASEVASTYNSGSGSTNFDQVYGIDTASEFSNAYYQEMVLYTSDQNAYRSDMFNCANSYYGAY